MQRSVYYHRSVAKDSQLLTSRIREITQTRVHYGYRRVHLLLRREGLKDNHKRVYRFYRQMGLSLRHKRPKRNKAAQLRQPKMQASQINQIWSMDFVADSLFDRRKLRMLNVDDCYTREACSASDGSIQCDPGSAFSQVFLASTRGTSKQMASELGSSWSSHKPIACFLITSTFTQTIKAEVSALPCSHASLKKLISKLFPSASGL